MARLANYLGGGNLSVGIGEEQVAEITASLKGVDADAEKLISSAINETCRHARTDIGKRIRDNLNLLARDVRDRIGIRQQSTPDNLVGVLAIDYSPVPIVDAKRAVADKRGGYKATYRTKSGVSVTMVKPEGRKQFHYQFIPKSIPYAFQRSPMTPKNAPKKGRYTLAARLARQKAANRVRPHKLKAVVARQPINKTFGPSVMRSFELAPGLADAALDNAGDYLQRRIASKVAWKLEGGTGGEPKGDN
jgi:hypothetical protein